MPKPKFAPWEDEKRNQIISQRVARGYRSAQAFADELAKNGLKSDKQSYLRRERGETQATADEIWYYAYVLGISPLEALDLFSRKPTSAGALAYAKDAVKHAKETTGLS